MAKMKRRTSGPWFLGIEGGATQTTAILATGDNQLMGKVKAGPANLRLLSEPQLIALLRSLKVPASPPAAMAIGLAGARTELDRQRIRKAAAKVWPGVPCYATNDLETGLMAGEADSSNRGGPASRFSANRQGRNPKHGVDFAARVLLLSGTGSCCFGRATQGMTVKVGGWGHILGDRGSGYDIGLRALQAVLRSLDVKGVWPRLGQRLLRKLQLDEPEDLVGWAQGAEKKDVAELAVEVFAAWSQRDPLARDIVESAARRLADDAIACARRLAEPGTPIQLVLAGGVLLKQPRFAKTIEQLVRSQWPNAMVTPLAREGAWGAVELARRHVNSTNPSKGSPNRGLPLTPALFPREREQRRQQIRQSVASRPVGALDGLESPVSLAQLARSPTEQRNPRSQNLPRLPLAQAIELMLAEDAAIPAAIRVERHKIERAVRTIVRAFRRGGRLLYVGAGTSGRLGVLDASECPPTFRTPPDLVQGIIAGGQRALWDAVEGVEDDPAAGARAIAFRGVTRKDVVVGIAASGRTPFVWGALGEAKARGAATILLCFNPSSRISRRQRPSLVIAPNVGPEVLTGSTRLKAGTATKLILNMFTTLAMVRLGKVISNLMVDLNPSNVKLRDRAVRMVQQLTEAEETSARAALEKSGWVVTAALKRLQRGCRGR